jgi:glycosyltransferase involved in cell wall biosynthesis
MRTADQRPRVPLLSRRRAPQAFHLPFTRHTYRGQPQEMQSPRRRRACILRRSDQYEHTVQSEAEALAAAGFDVEVICIRSVDSPRRAVVNGVTVIRAPVKLRSGTTGKSVGYGLFFLFATGHVSIRHIRKPYAVVQANSLPDFLVFAALVPKLLGCRVVAYMQEPAPELAATILKNKWITGLLARVEQWAIQFADHCVTVTDQLKQRYVESGAAQDRITVVLNCADPGLILKNWPPSRIESKSRFVVVCHGTIADRYGQDTILDAARLLRDEMPDLRVVITGRGPGTEELIKAIVSYELQDIVQFEGWVSQARLNDILYSADAGIVAQKASPYSHLVHTNKMMDYWIFGLPVIASQLHAVSWLYDESVMEYFEPGNAEDLAAAIRRLHADPARRAELARNGKIAEHRNGWATQRITYLSVFNSLLGNVATQRPEKLSPESTTAQRDRRHEGPLRPLREIAGTCWQYHSPKWPAL